MSTADFPALGSPNLEGGVNKINGTNQQSPQVTNENPTPKSSYAAMVNPEEGLELKFIEAPVISGIKCAKIDQQDVIAEVEYWNQAILCSVC